MTLTVLVALACDHMCILLVVHTGFAVPYLEVLNLLLDDVLVVDV
jgi:hypothetical protein